MRVVRAGGVRHQYNDGNGTFTFSGQSTNDGLLDFMLGLDSSFTQGMPAGSDLRQNYLGAYAQDDLQLIPIPTVPAKNAAFPLEGVYVNLPQDLKPTYMDQWSVSYQREFADWLFSGTYLGNKTTHLWLGTEQDPAVYIPGTCSGKPCSSTSNTSICATS
jgi:hypothetical protein